MNNKVHSHDDSCVGGSENNWYKFEQGMEVYSEETKKKCLKEFSNVLERLIVLRQTTELKIRQFGRIWKIFTMFKGLKSIAGNSSESLPSWLCCQFLCQPFTEINFSGFSPCSFVLWDTRRGDLFSCSWLWSGCEVRSSVTILIVSWSLNHCWGDGRGKRTVGKLFPALLFLQVYCHMI